MSIFEDLQWLSPLGEEALNSTLVRLSGEEKVPLIRVSAVGSFLASDAIKQPSKERTR
jgi:hypothetical protein